LDRSAAFGLRPAHSRWRRRFAPPPHLPTVSTATSPILLNKENESALRAGHVGLYATAEPDIIATQSGQGRLTTRGPTKETGDPEKSIDTDGNTTT